MVRTIILMAIGLWSCHGETPLVQEDFKAERVSKTASFTVDGAIEEVFPLFGAFEERKWEPDWKPILIYPDQEIIQEGTTFKVNAHGHGHGGESEFLWIVTKFDP
ncbi:MAG: hypothetical protein AAF391_10440, partial [Bacteroidota bacterium]